MSATPQIWAPEVLARLNQLYVRARQLVAGLAHGPHPSVRIARNVEFADYKEYSPGDPIRDLDWRVFARNDRLVVRKQQAETELAVTFILDASGDMITGETGHHRLPALEGSKFSAAVVLIATMAYYLQRRGEPVGLAILGGEGVEQPWIPPRRGRNHLARLFAALASIRPAGTAVLADGLAALGQRMRRRSMVIVASDLMEEPEQWGPQLAALTRRQIDLRVAHIYDRREMELDYRSASRFYSPEGGEALPVEPGSVKAAYREIVDEYLQEVRTWLAKRAALHVRIATEEPLDRALTRLLQGV
ncbi:MAG: DUF58 domain-containing protein [Myxococcota bacterium]